MKMRKKLNNLSIYSCSQLHSHSSLWHQLVFSSLQEAQRISWVTTMTTQLDNTQAHSPDMSITPHMLPHLSIMPHTPHHCTDTTDWDMLIMPHFWQLHCTDMVMDMVMDMDIWDCFAKLT